MQWSSLLSGSTFDGQFSLRDFSLWFIETYEVESNAGRKSMMMRRRIHLRWNESWKTETNKRNNMWTLNKHKIIIYHHWCGCSPSMASVIVLVDCRCSHQRRCHSSGRDSSNSSGGGMFLVCHCAECARFQLLAFYYLWLFIESFSRALPMTMTLAPCNARFVFAESRIFAVDLCCFCRKKKRFSLIPNGVRLWSNNNEKISLIKMVNNNWNENASFCIDQPRWWRSNTLLQLLWPMRDCYLLANVSHQNEMLKGNREQQMIKNKFQEITNGSNRVSLNSYVFKNTWCICTCVSYRCAACCFLIFATESKMALFEKRKTKAK